MNGVNNFISQPMNFYPNQPMNNFIGQPMNNFLSQGRMQGPGPMGLAPQALLVNQGNPQYPGLYNKQF